MTTNPRVVVTGNGVISPLGAGAEAFADALWNGTSAIAPSTRFPGSYLAEFKEFNPTPWLGNKGVRILDRGTRFLCVAAQMLLTSTGLSQDKADAGDPALGLVCGTIFGGVHSIAAFDMSGLVEGPSMVSPMEFPNTVINAPAGQAAIKHKLRGVNSTICAGLSSGLYAINYAAEFLRFGRARYLMAGGMEEVCDEASMGFRKLGLQSQSGSVRPFGTGRDGTAAGEGALRSGCSKRKKRRLREGPRRGSKFAVSWLGARCERRDAIQCGCGGRYGSDLAGIGRNRHRAGADRLHYFRRERQSWRR